MRAAASSSLFSLVSQLGLTATTYDGAGVVSFLMKKNPMVFLVLSKRERERESSD